MVGSALGTLHTRPFPGPSTKDPTTPPQVRFGEQSCFGWSGPWIRSFHGFTLHPRTQQLPVVGGVGRSSGIIGLVHIDCSSAVRQALCWLLVCVL